MTMRESNKLRVQCEARAEVVAFEWKRPCGVTDDSRVTGSVAAWRAAFPTARAHRRGIHTLYMRECDQLSISPAAIAHLRGAKVLATSRCARAVTAAAAALLRAAYSSTGPRLALPERRICPSPTRAPPALA
jgi:hypothetical protein